GFIFFFSSRRRHTRCLSDWSSDMCSSDLPMPDCFSTAHRTAAAVEAGFVWINEVGKHFLGVPFGGVKQSGIGREECFDEMLAFTQEKNIHVRLRPTR